jgi:PKD repeat protein
MVVAAILSIAVSLGLGPAAIIGPTDYGYDLEWDRAGFPPENAYFCTVTSDAGVALTKDVYDLSLGEWPVLAGQLNLKFDSTATVNNGELWIDVNKVRLFWDIESGPGAPIFIGNEQIFGPLSERLDLGTEAIYQFPAITTEYPSPDFQHGQVFLIYMVLEDITVQYINEFGVLQHTWFPDPFRISDYRADIVLSAPPPPNEPPTAIIEPNINSGRAPIWINFDASNSYDNDGEIVEAQYVFGDGETHTEPWDLLWGSDVNHEYTVPGTYEAILTVIDDEGGTGSATAQIVVLEAVGIPPEPTPPEPGIPISSITANPTTGDAPLQVQFTGSATDDGTITSWAWAFGDGGTSQIQSPLHEYIDNGTYTARLTVTDNDGNQHGSSVTIIVGDGAPAAFDWFVFIIILAVGIIIATIALIALGMEMVGVIFWIIITAIAAFIGWIISAGLWVIS